jgi:hypothetical protein
MLLTPLQTLLLVKRTVAQLDFRLTSRQFRPVGTGYGFYIVSRVPKLNRNGRVHPACVLVDRDSVTLQIPQRIAPLFRYNGLPPMSTGGFARVTMLGMAGTLKNGLISCTVRNPSRAQLLLVARALVAALAAQDV